jgi:hypothetical protein
MENSEKKTVGQPKKIKSPDQLFQLFQDYVNHVKLNPYKIKDWVGKDAEPIIREKEKPITMVGFENFVWLQDRNNPTQLSDYFANKNGGYDEFSSICYNIRSMIQDEQISGGMAGLYNPSITQRLNGLVEKQERKISKVGIDADSEEYI